METLLKEDKYTYRSKYGVLGSAVGVNLMAGFIYTWSILSRTLIEEFGWTSSQASLPYTLFTISFVLAMVVFGKAQDSRGPRLVSALGSISMGLGLILSGLFIDPKIMVFTVGIVTGSGVGMMTVATSPPVVKWFPPSKKGMVTGLVAAGAGLASLYYSPLASYLIAGFGLEKTFIFIGGGALIVGSLLSLGLKNPPLELCVDREGEESISCPDVKDYTWQEMLKSRDFYKIWLMFGFSASVGLMVIGHIASISKSQVGWQAGFILVIIFSISNTLGRISGGAISDKVGRMNLMKIVFSLQALNMLLFIVYTNKLTLIVGVFLAGLCYGTGFSTFPATISDLYGTKNFGINYGLMFTAWGLGGILGPMIAAGIYDSFNSYFFAYMVSFILLITSILLASRIKIRRE